MESHIIYSYNYIYNILYNNIYKDIYQDVYMLMSWTDIKLLYFNILDEMFTHPLYLT
jgi:hypothetical protein